MDDAFARDWLSCSIRPLLKPGGLVSAGAGFRKRLPQHPHWTLLLGLSGNCHFEGPRRSGIITDSSACLLPPFTPGELSATQPMTYYVVCFDVLTRKGRDPLADLQLPAVIPLRDGELMRRHCQEMLGLAADYAFRDAPARVRGRAVIDRMLADVLADGFALGVLLPATVFVLGIQLIGIYVASAAYIAVFMIWLGKYNWIKSVLLGVAISVATFMLFEIWFKVPLFKGAFNPLSIIGY